jgi:hypothetical protein
MPTFYGAIDLSKNEIRNAVAQNLASAPGTPAASPKGQFYYDTTNNILYWNNGSSWVAAQSGSSLTPASTVTTETVGDAGQVGSSANYAREDHRHPMPAFGAVSAETSYGIASSSGAATTIARSDHTHGSPSLTTNTPSTQAIGDAAAVGAGTLPAKDDHKHAMPGFGAITAETTFGAGSAAGSAATIARADHTHGNPVHDASAHSAIPLSALAVPTANLAMNSKNITGLLDPSGAQDAATKNYVDNAITGLDAKQSVKAASTATLTLSGTQTVDGIALVANDRILVKDQSTPATNGIYLVQAAAWTRATDMDAWAEVPGSFTWVEQGTVNADSGWICTADQGGTLGTTPITWTQFSGAGSITAGNGLSKVGSTLSVSPKGSGGIGVDGTGVWVDFVTAVATNTTVPRKYAAGLTGTASPETVTHNLGTRDVQVTVLNGSTPYTAVEVDWDATTTAAVTIRYNPNLGAGYRVVVVG